MDFLMIDNIPPYPPLQRGALVRCLLNVLYRHNILCLPCLAHNTMKNSTYQTQYIVSVHIIRAERTSEFPTKGNRRFLLRGFVGHAQTQYIVSVHILTDILII